jgi:carboxypeptidase A4
LFTSYHSYGQYILYPWGFDKRGEAPNARKMHDMATLAGKAMRANSGHSYTVGSAAKVLYPAAGNE